MSEEQMGMRQPVLGILGTIIAIFIAISLAMWFKPETFGSWVTFLAIACIPTQIILSLVWQNNYPKPAATLEQPLKGLYLVALMFLGGIIVGAWALRVAGGFITPPGPIPNFFIILSVVIALWLVVVWQCWPMAAIKQHPAFIGLGTLILIYVVNWIVFRIFFNFGFMEGAPVYFPHLDPGGLVMAWNAMAFAVTTVAVILAFVLLDFWPLSAIIPKSPSLAKQPIFGIAASIMVLIFTYIIWVIFVTAAGMDIVVFMLRVSICWIFGQFIMLLMMQTAPFQATKQPAKGLLLNIFATILAFIMYYIYAAFSTALTGGLPSGPPGYDLELWMATAMLGLSFPMMVVYSNFFAYWPLSESAPPPPAQE